MNIGKLTLKYGLALAPMAGVSDYTFRRLAMRYGAEYAVTEMISSKAMHYKDQKTATLARLRRGEDKVGVQIFGADPQIMAQAAEQLCLCTYSGCVGEEKPAVIDINAGCPVKKVVSNGEGSALMKSPTLLYDIVKAVKAVSSVPVTVKMRAGWDKEHKNALECARACEEAGADMICVHGRTRDEFYTPPVDLDIIASVKDGVKIPVFANGGIYTVSDAVKMLEYTKCDGVMIAQGALGNPFIFAEIRAYLENGEVKVPDNEERIAVMKEHLFGLIEDKGEFIGVCEARKHLGWYSAGMRDSAIFRGKVNTACTKDEMLKLIDVLFESK